MPRPPRIDLPGIAQHVAQRGNDRQPCVFAAADHPRYLTDLREPAAQAGVASHAYVLKTNRVHLLMTPPQAGRIGLLMQELGRRCVRYVDGALSPYRHPLGRALRVMPGWRSRAPPATNPLHRTETRPHRHGRLPRRPSLVQLPAHRTGMGRTPLSPHAGCRQLAAAPAARRAAWRDLVMAVVAPEQTGALRRHPRHRHALGANRFCRPVEAQPGLPCGPRRGVPPPQAPLSTPNAAWNCTLTPVFRTG